MDILGKSKHQIRIEEFMDKAKQLLPGTPTVPDADVRLLRAKLIFEEALETIEALGVRVWGSVEYDLPLNFDTVVFAIKEDGDLVQIADGCADLSVVTIGTLSACGLPDMPILRLVDDNNLEKFGPGHYIREDGKLIKPPDHKPPNLEDAIKIIKIVKGWGNE